MCKAISILGRMHAHAHAKNYAIKNVLMNPTEALICMHAYVSNVCTHTQVCTCILLCKQLNVSERECVWLCVPTCLRMHVPRTNEAAIF